MSFDTPEENQAFAEKYGFQYPLLCDTERKVGLAYGACTDAKAGGAARIAVVIGPDGVVKAYYPKVNARAFPTEVLETL